MKGQLYEEKILGTGGCRLCQTKMAETPYYIETAHVNIYSLEELCYYIYHNIFLLDETIINEALAIWIRNELDLKKLYHSIHKILDENGNYGDFVLLLFKEIHYLTHQEFKVFHDQLLRLEHEPVMEREKQKADYLVENGKYMQGIMVYRSVLSKVESSKMGVQFLGELYYNMGCTYMYMFQYEEALRCFQIAYEKLPETYFLKACLMACYLAKPYEQYEVLAERWNVPETMRKSIETRVQTIRDLVPVQEDLEQVDVFLKKVRKDYHNCTDH